jgi:hypothetical protein
MSESGTKEPCQSRAEGLLTELSPSETAIGGSHRKKVIRRGLCWILDSADEIAMLPECEESHVLQRLPRRRLDCRCGTLQILPKVHGSIPIVYQVSGYIVYRRFVLWVHRPGRVGGIDRKGGKEMWVSKVRRPEQHRE